MRFLDHKVPPPILVALVATAMWLASRNAAVVPMGDGPRLVIAGACLMLGLIVTAMGVRAFGRARTTINPVKPEAASSIVTSGVFRYTRNPMYVGFTLVLAGWAVYLATTWSFLGPAAFAIFIHRFQIIPEERVLSSKFGREYDDYRGRVRRWI